MEQRPLPDAEPEADLLKRRTEKRPPHREVTSTEPKSAGFRKTNTPALVAGGELPMLAESSLTRTLGTRRGQVARRNLWTPCGAAGVL